MLVLRPIGLLVSDVCRQAAISEQGDFAVPRFTIRQTARYGDRRLSPRRSWVVRQRAGEVDLAKPPKAAVQETAAHAGGRGE
jgi:hypothetical protein